MNMPKLMEYRNNFKPNPKFSRFKTEDVVSAVKKFKMRLVLGHDKLNYSMQKKMGNFKILSKSNKDF